MSISGMVKKTCTMNAGSVDCGEMDAVFKREPGLSHVVITSRNRPVSLPHQAEFLFSTWRQIRIFGFSEKADRFNCRA